VDGDVTWFCVWHRSVSPVYRLSYNAILVNRVCPDGVVMHVRRVQEPRVGREGRAVNAGFGRIIEVLDYLVEGACLVDRKDRSTTGLAPEVDTVHGVGWVLIRNDIDGSTNATVFSGQGLVVRDAAAVMDGVTDVDWRLGPVRLARGVDDIGTVQMRLVVLHTPVRFPCEVKQPSEVTYIDSQPRIPGFH